jgi:hypothetical protein
VSTTRILHVQVLRYLTAAIASEIDATIAAVALSFTVRWDDIVERKRLPEVKKGNLQRLGYIRLGKMQNR